jgi:Tfp pilus assembly protein PilN
MGAECSSISQAGEETGVVAQAVVERLVSVGRVPGIEHARLIVYGSNARTIEGLERTALPMENPKPDSSDRFGAIASGLAPLKSGPFDANLVPAGLRYRQNPLQVIPTYVLIALAVLLGVVHFLREPYQLNAYAAQIDDEIRKIAPIASEVAKQQTELNALSEKYRVLSANLKERDYNLEVLRELARVLPTTTFLSNYSYQNGVVTVSGFADSASEVQKMLEDHALFKEVQFTSSVTREPRGKDQFTLKATVEVPK